MDFYRHLLRPAFFNLEAERAHELAMSAMAWQGGRLVSLGGMSQPQTLDPGQSFTFGGLRFPNRVGLAAGFDKNARLTPIWPQLGFGHVEIGTVTPRPQEGNPRPRMFRLPKAGALLNRMGFNNEGAEAIRARLERERPSSDRLIIGGNIGKMRTTSEAEAYRDYLLCLEALHEVVDYLTVNISSPNTAGLRDLQSREPLWRLLGHLQERNHKLGQPRPILIKIAPDLDDYSLADIALVAQETQVAGIVATNTTLSREGMGDYTADHIGQLGAGGISGAPLNDRAHRMTTLLARMLPASFLLVSSGGIMTPGDARARIEAGADLVQLWTGFIYGGPGLVGETLTALSDVPAGRPVPGNPGRPSGVSPSPAAF